MQLCRANTSTIRVTSLLSNCRQNEYIIIWPTVGQESWKYTQTATAYPGYEHRWIRTGVRPGNKHIVLYGLQVALISGYMYVWPTEIQQLYMTLWLPLQTGFALLTQDMFQEKYSAAFYPQVFIERWSYFYLKFGFNSLNEKSLHRKWQSAMNVHTIPDRFLVRFRNLSLHFWPRIVLERNIQLHSTLKNNHTFI